MIPTRIIFRCIKLLQNKEFKTFIAIIPIVNFNNQDKHLVKKSINSSIKFISHNCDLTMEYSKFWVFKSTILHFIWDNFQTSLAIEIRNWKNCQTFQKLLK